MRKQMISLACAALCHLLASCTLPSLAAEPTGSPKFVLPDDGKKNKSFSEFRLQLLEAVKRRDKHFLDEVVAPDIRMVLGGESGKKRFLSDWLQLSSNSLFWARMERLLMHGAQLDHDSGEYHVPAVNFEDSSGENSQGIVWNKDSALRKTPDDSAPVVRTLYDQQLSILEPAEPSPVSSKWIKVQTRDGATGYMRSEDVDSAYDEFATFKKLHQKWYLIWFGVAAL